MRGSLRGGEVLTFKVTLATQGFVDLGALSSELASAAERPAPRRVSSKLSGTLIWQQQGLRVVVWIEGARVLLDSADAKSAETQALAAALRVPALVALGNLGEIQGVIFPSQAPQAVRQLTKTLLSLLQCVRRRRDTATWDSVEDDLAGTIQARYQHVPGGAIEKRVMAVSGEEASIGKATPEGVIRFVHDSHGLVTASGERTLALTLDGKRFSRSAVQLQLQRLRVAPLGDLASVPEGEPEPLSARLAPVARALAIHRSALGKETAATLTAALLAVEQSKEKVNEGDLFVKLRALFVLQPTQAAAFVPLLRTAKAESQTLRILTLALSAANTLEAQRALVTVARARLDDYPVLQAILPTLVEQARWTAEAEALVCELAGRDDDQGKMATFLIGSAIHALAPSDTARAERLVSLLLKRLEEGSADDKRLILGALGNAGLARTLPKVLPFLTDPDPATRAEATDALRLIVTDDTSQRLCTLLRSDPESVVRRQAAITLGFRPLTPQIQAALTAASTQDASESVRSAAKETLQRGQP